MLDTIKDSAKDLFANVNSRLTNPFLGTLIFVWIVRNFEFVFTLFNFDDDCSREEKIKIIQDYFLKYCIWKEALINIGVSLLIMILTFLVLWLTRLLTNMYTAATDWLNGKTALSSMVSRTSYDKLNEKYHESKSRNRSLEEEALDHNSEMQKLKNDLDMFQSSLHEKKEAVRVLESDKVELSNKSNLLENELNEFVEKYNNESLLKNNFRLTALVYFIQEKAKNFNGQNLDIYLRNIDNGAKNISLNELSAIKEIIIELNNKGTLIFLYILCELQYNKIYRLKIRIASRIIKQLIENGLLEKNIESYIIYKNIQVMDIFHVKITNLGFTVHDLIKNYFEKEMEIDKKMISNEIYFI